MKLTTVCHQTLSKYIKPDWTVVDATLGNGHDALFLLQQLKGSGQLIGFDIQDAAITNTQDKLAATDYNNYQLIKSCHSKLQTCLAEKEISKINLITYNFGYLPGGDHEVTTESETSLESIQQAMQLLAPGGIMSLMLYPGHPAGKVESKAIEDFIELNTANINWTKNKGDSEKSDAPFYLIGVIS